MESQIFNSIGLSGIDPAIIFIALLALVLILLIMNIVQSCRVKKLEKKYNRFMKGKEAESLEEEIVNLFNENSIVRAENEKNRKEIQRINRRMQKSFQKMGLEKYDAFNQMGGQLSFALCLLDENDNGYLINSVHSTDGLNYSYAKEINAGVADVELSEEEKAALDKALVSADR